MVSINEDLKSVLIDGKDISLTKSEYNLFLYLFKHQNKLYTRRELITELWDNKDAYLRSVDVVVSRINKKLKNSGTKISSKTGFGYYLKCTH